MFSTSLCLSSTHLIPMASNHANCSRRYLTTLTIRKSTDSSTLSDATRISCISYSGQASVTYRLGRNLQRISAIHRNWRISFTKNTGGSLDDDWTFFMGVVLFLSSYGSWAGIDAIGMGLTTYHWRLSFPAHRISNEAAQRALIGCSTH
jgi:hypothetical protein